MTNELVCEYAAYDDPFGQIYDDFLVNVDEAMSRFRDPVHPEEPATSWCIEGVSMGWRNLHGSGVVHAEGARGLLEKIGPRCDRRIEVYAGRELVFIFYTHDSPTGEKRSLWPAVWCPECGRAIEDTVGNIEHIRGYGWCPECSYDDDIRYGDDVVVPDPYDYDAWGHSFSGSVIGFRECGIASVEDQDGNVYDVEVSRLEKEEANV